MSTQIVEPVPKIPADLRLLPAATGSWLGALAGGLLVAVAAWPVAAGLLVLALWSRRRPALAVGLLMVATGMAVASIGRLARTTGPVADLARRAGIGHVELTISSDPQRLPAVAHLPPAVLIQAQVRRLDTNGQR